MSETPFDDLSDVYEAMVDWPKRLAAEAPFYRRVFERAGVRRVADVACGTGQHAAMFHAWGINVEGSDVSPAMIGRARAAFGEPPGLRWSVRGFEEPPGEPGSFDAVLCVGNSLALAPGAADAAEALRQMLRATRAGGVVIVHVLNLWRFPDGPCVWQKATRKTLARGGRSLILKGVHRCGQAGHVELVVVADDGGTGGDSLRSHSVRFLGLRAEDLRAVAAENGAAEVTFFGGYQDQPYDPAASPDLIVVARKG